MSVQNIKNAIEKIEKYYETKPGPESDTSATAIIENGLRCCIRSPDGKSVNTDMPESVGGAAMFNSPGWLSRAAIASCDATLLAMRAAREGVELDSIEVKVESISDGRGMFLDEGVSPASTEIRVLFDIRSTKASRNQIEELVEWVAAHSPVANDIANSVNVLIDLKTE